MTVVCGVEGKEIIFRFSDTADLGSIFIWRSEIAAEENPRVPMVSNTVSE